MRHFLFLIVLAFPVLSMAQAEFEHHPESPHYLIVLPKPGWADMKDMVAGFAKHNARYYLEDKLFVKQYKISKEDKIPFVMVGEFAGELPAMLYFEKLRKPPVLFLQAGVATDYFIISAENYNEVLSQKSFANYRKYFHEKYPD